MSAVETLDVNGVYPLQRGYDGRLSSIESCGRCSGIVQIGYRASLVDWEAC